MKRNKKNGIDSFLNSSGVLEHGSDEDIREAKKKYWSHYKKEWNKTKRQECKSFEILLNPNELKIVTSEAQKNHTSPTNYIKQSALSQKKIVNDITIGEIRELIVMHHNILQSYTDGKVLPAKIGDPLIEQISKIEERVLNFFTSLK